MQQQSKWEIKLSSSVHCYIHTYRNISHTNHTCTYIPSLLDPSHILVHIVNVDLFFARAFPSTLTSSITSWRMLPLSTGDVCTRSSIFLAVTTLRYSIFFGPYACPFVDSKSQFPRPIIRLFFFFVFVSFCLCLFYSMFSDNHS